MRCPKCNFPVLPKFDKCPKCGTPLKEAAPAPKPAADFDFDAPAPNPAPKPAARAAATDFDFDAPAMKPAPKPTQPVDGLSIISGKAVWSLGPGQIARRISEREMADCGAVKGVVVQDGVTAAVFSDGKLVQTLDGGIYRFSDETITRDGKTVTVTPQGEEIASPAAEAPQEKRKRGFLSRLFGARKETAPVAPSAPAPASAPKQHNTSVVTVYLISSRIFEEAFGSAGSVEYAPFEVKASGTPLRAGVAMQLRVTDFDTFRRQYLVESNEVSVESMRRLMTPWVKDILTHAFAGMQVADGRLTEDQQKSLKQTLGAMLSSRLFGVSIINIYDVATTDAEFDRLERQRRELETAERENDIYVRETEFRNRLADFEMRQEAERQVRENDGNLDREKEYVRFETALAELNRDKLLTEDELRQFMAQHEMEMRLADAARNADEQTRAYESEKILNELADKKLIDGDDRKALEERIANGQFERGQLNDLLRHKALVGNALEKLRLDTDLAMQQANASHELDLNAMRQETERTDLESILYGKRYAIDRQKVRDELEINSIRLDADLETRRKEDAYAEERYQLDRKHDHDDWEERFMREGKEMERKRESLRADADLDFDIRSRQENFDFDMGKRRDEHDFDMDRWRAEHDFDMESRKAQFDFDLDDRRMDKDVERTARLSAVEQAAADRQHARDMEMCRQQQEELRLKGSIAMENMKAMMEAKRATRKDELDAETDKLNIKSTMSAEQIAAEQLRHLDAAAQSGFMDALREKSSSAKEAELARREAEMTRQMHEQMMGRADSMHEQNRNDMKEMMAQMMQMQQMSQQQAMDLARHSMDTSANIAASQAASNASAAERRVADLERDNQRYREDALHSQERVDANQTQSLDYATRVTEIQTMRETVKTVPLNTAWLREHGFGGSFNELAGQLSSLGGAISKDFDADGNPVIVVDGLPEGQVFDTLQAFGVQF